MQRCDNERGLSSDAAAGLQVLILLTLDAAL